MTFLQTRIRGRIMRRYVQLVDADWNSLKIIDLHCCFLGPLHPRARNQLRQ